MLLTCVHVYEVTLVKCICVCLWSVDLYLGKDNSYGMDP